MLVRPRRDHDLPAAIRLLRRVHDSDGYPTRWPVDPGAWLTPPDLAGGWIAADGDRVLGHAALVRCADPTRVELVRLFTDPDVRGSGAGRSLTVAALTYARQRGWTVWLEVVASTGAAVAFYERAGWRRTATTFATWTAADGSHPELVHFDQPA